MTEPPRNPQDPAPDTSARARLLLYGAEALSPAELIGLVVGEKAPELGGRILSRFGSLRGAARGTLAELRDVSGMGPSRAVRLQAAFALGRAAKRETLLRGAVLRSSREVFERFHEELRDLKREVFVSVLLDGKNRVLKEDRVSVGSLTSSIVHPREVFCTAIRESADGVVFVHNHPSGDPTPSAEDLDITSRLVEVSRLVGIRVLDHVVVGDGTYVSFHEKGLLHDD